MMSPVGTHNKIDCMIIPCTGVMAGVNNALQLIDAMQPTLERAQANYNTPTAARL